MLVTGSVADHFNRKTIALITVGAEVFTSAALMFYALSKPTSVMPLFMIAFTFGIAPRLPGPGDAIDAADGRAGRSAPEGDRPVLGDLDRGDHRRSGDRRLPLRSRPVGGLPRLDRA